MKGIKFKKFCKDCGKMCTSSVFWKCWQQGLCGECYRTTITQESQS